MEIDIEEYTSVQSPCIYSNPEHPRGGCIMFIKKHLMKFVKGVDKKLNDSIAEGGGTQYALHTACAASKGVFFRCPKVLVRFSMFSKSAYGCLFSHLCKNFLIVLSNK